MVDIPVYEGLGETLATATTNGQAIFAYTFLAFDETQVKAEFRPTSGPAVPLVLNTNYTVSGLNQPNGGAITLVGVTVVSGDEVYIYRETPIEREKDWQNEGDYKADLVNREQDEIYMIMQELKRAIGKDGEGIIVLTAALADEVAARISGDQSLSDRIDQLTAPSKWLVGSGAPSDGIGIVGDMYLDADTGNVYGPKSSSTWGGVSASLLGPKGDKGDPGSDYPNVASVQAANIPVINMSLRTDGYYAAGDGGGALYKRVASEPSHAGKIQSADGAWWELAELCPDLLMFGAKGDSATSDSHAFQAAYDFMKVKGGGKVTVTEKTGYYRVDTTIIFDNTINFTLSGIGSPLIMDVSTDGSNTFNVGNGVHSGYRTIFENLRIWGKDNPQNGTALNLSYAGNTRIDNVNIFRHAGFGIDADNCWTMGARHSSVVGCLLGNVRLSGATGNGSVWIDCTFNDCPTGKFSFHIAGTDGVANPANGPHFGTTFIGCKFEYNDFGLFATYAHALNLIGANYFEFNTTNAFRIVDGCKGVNIHGNSIFTSPGLVLNADMIDIRGNQCEWDGSIDVGDSTNVSWGPNGVANKPNTIFGTTRNMEYEAFPAWVTYTSLWISSATQPSLGNGTLVFKYKRRGNTVQCSVMLTVGSTSTFGSVGYGFRLPFNVAAGVQHLGVAGYLDNGAVEAHNLVAVCEPGANYVGLRNAAGSAVGPTSPITFATGDKIYATFTYECVS